MAIFYSYVSLPKGILFYQGISSVPSKEPSTQHRLEGSLHGVPARPSRVVYEPPSWAGGIPPAQRTAK